MCEWYVAGCDGGEMRSQVCKQTTHLEREEKMKISKPVKYEENSFAWPVSLGYWAIHRTTLVEKKITTKS